MDKIYSFKKALYDNLAKLYNINKQSMNTRLFTEYYNKVLPLNKLEDINQIYKELQVRINEISTKYNNLLKEYNKNKSKKIYDYLLEIKAEYDVLMDIYNIFKQHLSVTKQVPTTSDLDYDSKSYLAICQKIMELKNECFKLEYNDLKASELRSIIYALCIEREKMVSKVLGVSGINKLRLIESKEDMVMSKKDELDDWVLLSNNIDDMKEPTTITLPEYINYLRQTFREISGIEFDIESTMEGIKGKRSNVISTNKLRAEEYKEIVKKNYYNLIKSLNDPKVEMLSEALLNYLSIYNIEGGYSTFKKHYSNGKIGNEAISMNLYKKGIANIETLMEEIISLAKQNISKKMGEITINNYVKTKRDGIEELRVMDANLLKEMLKVKSMENQMR